MSGVTTAMATIGAPLTGRRPDFSAMGEIEVSDASRAGRGLGNATSSECTNALVSFGGRPLFFGVGGRWLVAAVAVGAAAVGAVGRASFLAFKVGFGTGTGELAVLGSNVKANGVSSRELLALSSRLALPLLCLERRLLGLEGRKP